MANARPFSISTFQDLSNDTKNTPIQGVFPLAVELWTFGSPGELQIPTLSKCWASPPHLAKVGLRQVSLAQERNPNEIVEASSILSEIGGKNVEIPDEVMEKPLIPIVEEVETQLVEDISRKPLFLNQNVSTKCDYNYVATRFFLIFKLNNGNY